jgi:ArsR family transcriptional regulator, lead/cadmium/zinc/bismuth-responsive transcriptional repressor
MVTKAGTVTPIDPEAVAHAAAAAPVASHITMSAETFEVLANPTRLRILYALMAHSLCVRDLSILVGVSESAVSHQLRILRDRRVVKSQRDGNVIRYVLDDMHVAAVLREADYHAEHVQKGLNDHPYSLDHRQE